MRKYFEVTQLENKKKYLKYYSDIMLHDNISSL